MDCDHHIYQDTGIANARVECDQKIVTHWSLITTRVYTLLSLWQTSTYVQVTAEPIRA